VNINDMTQKFKKNGNHGLEADLFGLFVRDQELRQWRKYFEENGGFSQDSWYPMWDILIKELDITNFLDLGVHAGQFSVLPQLLALRHGKEFMTYSVSPFDGTGDKYSNYHQQNYLDVYMKAIRDFKLDEQQFVRLRGLSNDPKIYGYLDLNQVKFQLMYIDGSHEYDFVVFDIENYVLNRLSPGGIVIFDDAHFFTPVGAPPAHRQGYEDVVRAVQHKMDEHPDFEHLFDLTHNRIFRRKE